MAEGLAGGVTHYFSRIAVAVLSLEAPLSRGDKVRIVGHTTYLARRYVRLKLNTGGLTSFSRGMTLQSKLPGRYVTATWYFASLVRPPRTARRSSATGIESLDRHWLCGHPPSSFACRRAKLAAASKAGC